MVLIMRFAATVIIISAAAGITLAAAGSSRAEDTYDPSIYQPGSSPLALVRLLDEAWLVTEFQLKPEENRVKFAYRADGGPEVHFEFSDCVEEKDTCDRLWMWTKVQPETDVDLAAVNRWNEGKTYIFAYLDEEDGQVVVGFERSLRGGYSPITVTADLRNLLRAADLAVRGLPP
jgi:hypothetical protein